MPEIPAVYEHGLLRPLEPLSLEENQKVKIRVILDTDTGDWLTKPSGHAKSKPVSLEDRLRVAKILGETAKKPVSEMVIEDRGKW
jgi:predicted DNA-binding antitoxin AbrB/MazE fold protein